MRKVFLDDLPHSKSGKTIKWNECVGREILFEYDNISGYFTVLDYKPGQKDNKIKSKLFVSYNEKTKWVETCRLQKCEIGKLIGAKMNCSNRNISWKYNIGDKIKCNANEIIITKIKKGKGYQFICNNCGYDCSEYYKQGKCFKEYWLRLNKKKNCKNICPCCANTIVVPGINDLATLTPDIIKYFPGKTYEEKKKIASKYRPYSSQKVNIQCPDCGEIHRNIIIANIQKGHFGCKCKDGYSYPEKFMISILNQIDIDYKYQKIFEWCKFFNPYKNYMTFGKYDFYIPSLNLIIEMDGGYGHGNYADTYENDIYIDNMKDKLAIKNGITVIRIDSTVSSKEYLVESIKNSNIPTYLNIRDVDFEVCHNYAKSNIRRKVVDEYIKDNTYAQKLAEKYGVSPSTVLNWIKLEGMKYKSSYEFKGKYNMKNAKPIIVNNILYPSARICQERSIEDFGVLLNAGSLRSAILRNQKYKGLDVKYA